MHVLLSSPEPLIAGYHAVDLIPFSAEAYQRMLAAVNHSLWPTHLLSNALALLILYQLWHARPRVALRLLALLWLGCGGGYFWTFYADLNWAGEQMAIACVVQAGLLVWLASGFHHAPNHRAKLPGYLIALLALVWPLSVGLSHAAWQTSETVGLHADPTSLFTLGVLLCTRVTWRIWLLAIVPLAWTGWSALTLYVLQQSRFGLLAATIAFAMAVLLYSTALSIARSRR